MSYRDLSRATRPVFLPLGFLARLPYSITPLGTLLLLASVTGGYGFAGAAAGAQSLAIGAGGIVLGRFVERFGPRRVGATMAVLNALAIGGLVAATYAGRPAMFAAAVLVGATQPQIGSLVRVHWSYLGQRRPGLVATALPYESAADELSFVVGPVAVAALTAVAGPMAPLLAAAALLLTTAVPFALDYAAQAPAGPGAPQAQTLPRGPMAAMMLAMAAIGAVFGALQTGVAAYSTAHGESGLAGVLYAELGVGSALAGLAYARLPRRFGLPSRYLTFAATLVVGMTVVATGGLLLPLQVVMLLGGATIAPYMISVYAVTERLSPGRIATAMSLLTAGGPVGTATAQALAGRLTDAYGPHAGFFLAPAIAVLGLALALATTPGHRRRHLDTIHSADEYLNRGSVNTPHSAP